jgi:beta-galactosidase
MKSVLYWSCLLAGLLFVIGSYGQCNLIPVGNQIINLGAIPPAVLSIPQVYQGSTSNYFWSIDPCATGPPTPANTAKVCAPRGFVEEYSSGTAPNCEQSFSSETTAWSWNGTAVNAVFSTRAGWQLSIGIVCNPGAGVALQSLWSVYASGSSTIIWGMQLCSSAACPTSGPSPPVPPSPPSTSGFTISDDATTFLANGVPTRLVSGSFHYFRAPAVQWASRLALMAAGGLNAVQTYIAWNFHCPEKDEECDFSGDRNITHFFELAQSYGLYVILRPGPYICAEWDLGGFPSWLFAVNRSIQLRTSDPLYLHYVSKWYDVLLPNYIRPQLFENGGPIVLVQIENEYGSFGSDKVYLRALVNYSRTHLGENVVLHSTDSDWSVAIMNTAVEGVFQTVDFFYYGTPKEDRNVTRAWENQVTAAKQGLSRPGPNMNSEFYPGWFTSWGDSSVKTLSSDYVIGLVEEVLVDVRHNSSLNFYMYFGGTNYGFWSSYLVTTSYDYDAPLSEDGRPNEPRYSLLSNLLPLYLPLRMSTEERQSLLAANVPPLPANYGNVTLDAVIPLYDYRFIEMIGRSVAEHGDAKSMEELGQSFGYTAYSFKVNDTITALKVPKVRDYVMAYFDGVYMGFLLRDSNDTFSFGATGVYVDTVLLLIDNNGRKKLWSSSDPDPNDLKGLVENVRVYPVSNGGNAIVIEGYLSYTLPMEHSDLMKAHWKAHPEFPWQPTMVFKGNIILSSSTPNSTWVDVSGWGRGFVMVNGHNLGRFWTVQGPQRSLYCPGEWLYLDGVTPNEFIILEQYRLPLKPGTTSTTAQRISGESIVFGTLSLSDQNRNIYAP